MQKTWLGMMAALLSAAVASGAMLTATPAAAQSGVVRCESTDGRFNRCQMPWRDATLVRQESHGECIRGESWGVDRSGLWVDHGCRGLFGAGQDRRNDRDQSGREHRGRDQRGNDSRGRRGHNDRDDRDHDGRDEWRPGAGWDRSIRLDCHSNQERYQLCQVDVGRAGRVVLERQVSDSPCREGESWGWNRAGVWVAHGCRAQFRVDRRW